jgi:hypothetical protein
MQTLRSRYICSRVEQLLAPGHVLGNPAFASFVIAGNLFPMAALLTDPLLIRSRASMSDLSTACADLHFDLIHSHAAGPQIPLPYTAFSNTLVLKSTAKRWDIVPFLRLLTGSNAFEMRFIGSGYLVKAEPAFVFALWRALKFVPFHGELIEAKMSSSLSRHKEEQPGRIISLMRRPFGNGSAAPKDRRKADDTRRVTNYQNSKWTWRPSIKVPAFDQ